MRERPIEQPPAFLPTLAQAHAQGLPVPDGEPTAQERWSALIVLTNIVRRRSWKEEIYRHANSVAHLPRGNPPAPTAFVGASFAVVEDIADTGVCSECSHTPGRRKCRVCNGRGYVFIDGRNINCSCSGGSVPCPNCQGQKVTSRIQIRYYEDEPKFMRELYVPSHLPCNAPLFGLETAVEGAVNLSYDPPEELRCHDLTGRAPGSAYRGGERYVRPTFHGFDYGDTIEKAIEGMRALGAGGRVLLHDTRAYAWPMLRLQFASEGSRGVGRDLILYFDRSGSLRLFSNAAER